MSPAPVTVLVVDDDPQARRLTGRMLGRAGYRTTFAASAREARDRLATEDCALVLCDVVMPGETGLELVATLADRAPDVVTLMLTGGDDPELAAEAAEHGAYGYLVKPCGASELQMAVAGALHRRGLELDRREVREQLEADVRRSQREVVHRLSLAVEQRDPETGSHIERIGSLSAAVAERCGMAAEEVELLRTAAPMHDVGKLGVPDDVLRKPGPLTAPEREAIERHPELGHRLLAGSGIPLLDLAATVALTHHERWDGGGYPQGLTAEAIPLAGRIVAAADVYDALTSDRVYRRALSPDEAVAIVVAGRGTHFDPAVTDALLAVVAAPAPPAPPASATPV